jgi:hypothetical protein
MRCHQCERPAIYKIADKVLCLDCADRLQSLADRQQSIIDRQFIQNAAMMNMALDDMDAVAGFLTVGGRIPVREIALAMKGRTVLNNIHIANSNVGVVNTGDLARIDAAITMTKHTDVEAVGAHIQRLTQAILDAAALDQVNKQEMLDVVQTLADQVVRERKPSVIKALVKSLEDRAQGVAALVTIVEGLSKAITNLFGG